MNQRTRLGDTIIPGLRRHALAWGVLLISLIVTVGAWLNAQNFARGTDLERVRRFVSEARLKIEERLRSHEQVLLGASALFDGDASVRRERWKKYATRWNLPARSPGVLGLGYLEIISRGQKEEMLARLREQGLREFNVNPTGKREVYAPVVMLEPSEGMNSGALGFDMWTDPVLKAGLVQARDTRMAALTAPVTMTQEEGSIPISGVMLFVPVYWELRTGQGESRPMGPLRGWVYSPIVAKDFLRGIESPEATGVRLEVRDAGDGPGGSLLFTSHESSTGARIGEAIDSSVTLEVFGRSWMVSARLSGESAHWARANVIGGMALITSLLLFAITLHLSRTRHRAIGSASEMTRQLEVKSDELRAIYDHAPVAVVEISADSKTVRLNKRCEELVGLTQDQAQDWGWSRRIHPDDRQGVALAFQTALTRGAEFESEYRIQSENDWVKWVHVKLAPIREQERLSRFLGVVEDISAQKDTAFATERSDKFLDALINAIPHAAWVSDEAHRWVLVNDAFCARFGKSRASLVGATDSELLSPEQTQRSRDEDHLALQSGETVVVEEQFMHASGEPRWWRGTKYAFTLSDGTRYVAGYAIDITEMRQAALAIKETEAQLICAQSALKDAEEQLRAVFEAHTDGIVVTNEQGIIQSVNAAASRMFGFEAAELRNQRLSMLMPEQSREENETGFRHPIDPRFRANGRRRNGDEFLMEVTISEMTIGEETVSLCVIRDITDKVAAEEEIKQYRVRLRELEEEKGRQAGRNMEMAPKVEPAKSDFLAGRIEEVGQHLLSSLDELLDLSKLRAAIARFDFYEMNGLVRTVVEELGALARRQGVSVTVECSEPAVNAWCDLDRIRQVVRILLSNAIRFTPTSKAVRVRIGQSWLPDGRRSEDLGIVEAAEVSVIDEGMSVPDSELERVFDNFVESDGTGRGEAAKGWGLAICREIIRQHGGYIAASHNPAGGAVFTFTLPCRQPSRETEKVSGSSETVSQ